MIPALRGLVQISSKQVAIIPNSGSISAEDPQILDSLCFLSVQRPAHALSLGTFRQTREFHDLGR